MASKLNNMFGLRWLNHVIDMVIVYLIMSFLFESLYCCSGSERRPWHSTLPRPLEVPEQAYVKDCVILHCLHGPDTQSPTFLVIGHRL